MKIMTKQGGNRTGQMSPHFLPRRAVGSVRVLEVTWLAWYPLCIDVDSVFSEMGKGGSDCSLSADQVKVAVSVIR